MYINYLDDNNCFLATDMLTNDCFEIGFEVYELLKDKVLKPLRKADKNMNQDNINEYFEIVLNLN